MRLACPPFYREAGPGGGALAVAAAAALLWLAAVFGAVAQTTDADRAALRVRQTAAIDAIERAAAARGPVGSPERTAVLRAGLPMLGDIVSGIFDFDAARPGSIGTPPQPIDSDPAFQKRLLRRYDEARNTVAEAAKEAVSDGGRIVGGRPVRDPEYSSTVAIVQTSRPKCTGSHLGAGRILTAAHCVCDLELDRPDQGWRIAFGDAVPYGAFLGRPTRTLAIDPARSSIFPAVDGATSNFCRLYRQAGGAVSDVGPDLAILRIRDPLPPGLPETRLGTPAMLARTVADDGDLAQPFHAVGFGRSWDNGVLRVTGRKRAAYLLSGETCPESGRLGLDNVPCIAGREVSALDSSGRDTCRGDSGGPLFVSGDGPDDWRLVAVTSRGLRRNDPDCGGGGVYALVTSVEVDRWLRENGVPLP